MLTSYRKQLIKFLKAIDKTIDQPTKLYIIGGGSITLAYDYLNKTVDLDIVEASSELIELAGEGSKLAKQYGFYIQKVSEIGFAAPSNWRTKTKKLSNPTLKKITIYVPEIHDIMLGKLARLEHRDIEDIASCYSKGLINIDYFIKRLNDNKKELKNIKYRQNVIAAFDLIFQKKITFKKGKASIKR